MITNVMPPSNTAPRNLLDNSCFLPGHLVNQRGQTSYTTAWGMSIDRWYLANSRNQSEAQTLTLTSNGLMASGNCFCLIQRIAPKLDDNKLYTMAYQRTDGVIYADTIRGSEANPAIYDFSQVQFGFEDGATIVWTALYEGAFTADALPPYTPRPYSVELAECQRYFYKLGDGGTRYAGNMNSEGKAWFSIPIPTSMRIPPTINTASTGTIASQGEYVNTTSSYSVAAVVSNSVLVILNHGGTQNGEAVLCDLTCELNAEL